MSRIIAQKASTAIPGTISKLCARKAPPESVISAGTSHDLDRKYNGAFVSTFENGKCQAWSSGTNWKNLEGKKPDNGKPAIGKLLYINGIDTTMQEQGTEMQVIANASCQEVIGIHNATSGLLRDIGECFKDKMNVGNNAAHKTLMEAIYTHLKSHPREPLNILAYSQGSIIASRALRDVRRRLMGEDGYTRSQAVELLQNIRVQTMACAAVAFPKGPQYLHHVNTEDPVPKIMALTGLRFFNRRKQGPVHKFTVRGNVHSAREVYAAQLVAFNELSTCQRPYRKFL